MGYVGDAHIKIAYLFDVNSLPENLRSKIREGGPIGDIVKEAKPPEILQATVARSIVKLGKTEEKTPAIFIEPTYSSINKENLSMDTYFNLFLNIFVAEPMKSPVFRGAGREKITIPQSRSPKGQYEDGAGGNANHGGMGIQASSYTIQARSVSKKHVANAEEEKIIETMRRSSR